MELQHFSHQHSLVFIQYPEQRIATEEEACCRACGKLVDCPSYCCIECKFYLHKNCAELCPEINHISHPQHLLTLLSKSSYEAGMCDICGSNISGFVYHCDSCEFDLDVNCALLQSSIVEKFPNYLHEHPVIFIQNHTKEINSDCAGCGKPLYGPLYLCLICDEFRLHKECAELPFAINHPYDRRHPLFWSPNPPIHPKKCRCLGKKKPKGFVYCCSHCKIELTLEEAFAPRTITADSHDHPWTLLPREMSFICDFCGTNGDRSPYVCCTCGLLFHKDCTSLPPNIMITRHQHVISHSLQQGQLENWKCRICYGEVDTRYGCYYCPSDCNYIAHVKCATDEEIWDRTIILKDKDEDEYMNLITIVTEERSSGGDLVATEIKHAYHDHKLIPTFSDKISDDEGCSGCMNPLSTYFYRCDQCEFFLHKSCAELPKKIRHPFHKHLLKLPEVKRDNASVCSICDRFLHGFIYECQESCDFKIDIQCSFLSDTLKHPSHEHLLFLVHNYGGKCSGCRQEIYPPLRAYRCTGHCDSDFTLDLKCVTLPLTTRYKYDKQYLTLTGFDDSDPSQHYCDLCEKERDPNHFFYHCADCDNSLHSECALGQMPFIKLGSSMIDCGNHPHPLYLVKTIWNCPRCEVCRELCHGQTLQCKESECNVSVHPNCRHFLGYTDVFDL